MEGDPDAGRHVSTAPGSCLWTQSSTMPAGHMSTGQRPLGPSPLPSSGRRGRRGGPSCPVTDTHKHCGSPGERRPAWQLALGTQHEGRLWVCRVPEPLVIVSTLFSFQKHRGGPGCSGSFPTALAGPTAHPELGVTGSLPRTPGAQCRASRVPLERPLYWLCGLSAV